MKFMTMVHETKRPSPEPPPELFAAIGGLQAKTQADGTLVEVGGLMPIDLTGAIVTLSGGSITTTDGPFVEAKELIGGYAVYDVPDVAAANALCEEFLRAHHDAWPGWEGWVEVRAMFEAPPQ